MYGNDKSLEPTCTVCTLTLGELDHLFPATYFEYGYKYNPLILLTIARM